MSAGSRLRHVAVQVQQRISGLFEAEEVDEPLRENEPWNDSINENAEGMFRVYYQNVRGIGRDPVTAQQDCQMLEEMDVGCVCLSETNLDWNRPYVVNDYHTTQRRRWKYCATSMASIELPTETEYIHGGTVTFAVNGWSSRVSQREKDPSGMGRWTSLTFVGRKDTKFTVITGYRCVQNRLNGSVCAQETVFLRDRQSIDYPTPRKQFILDLIEFVRKKQEQNHEILICLDANEIMGDDSCGIAKVLRDCHLFDVFDEKEPDIEKRLKDTYRRGKDRRIDFILASRNVVDTVTRCGALSYNHGIASDHRGMFVDIDFARLLGGQIQDPVAPASRGFTSKNKKRCRLLLKHLNRYFEDHRVEHRVNDLVQRAGARELSVTEIRTRYNAIDRDITRGKLAASRKIKPKRSEFEWSEALDQAGMRHRFWKIRESDCRANSTSHRALSNIIDRCGFTESEEDVLAPKTLEELKKLKNDAFSELKAAQRAHRKNHDDDLNKRLEEARKKVRDAEDPKEAKKAVTAIETIIRSGRRAESYARIKRVTKPPSSSGGLDRLDVPMRDPDGNIIYDEEGKEKREILLEVNTIHKALLARNKQHFHQAADTPFGHGELARLVGYTGLTEAADAIVQGTFLPQYEDKLKNELLPETRQIIRELAMPPVIKELPKIKRTISKDEFISGIKKWKESTSTSPSGRHLGFYKVLVNVDAYKKEEQDARDDDSFDIEDITIDFLDIMVKMVNLPLEYGFVPDRWCNSITVMIEKDPGSPKIERLRIIHLFEADFNFALKTLWARRLVHRGMDSDTLGTQQHAIPGRQALDAFHMKTLSYDLARITKTNIVMFDNDASACYDRIIISLLTISARAKGMSKSSCRMHARTLKHMKYYVKTAHGTSEEYYTLALTYLLFGTGQGSGGSPSAWLQLCTTALRALSKLSEGSMKYTDPWSEIINERNADGYVDDCSNGVSDAQYDEPLPLDELLRLAQQTAQTWERILFTIGQSLNLSKCFWQLIYWKWHDGRPVMSPIAGSPGLIALTKGKVPNYSVIQRHDYFVAKRMLGVRAALDGNYRKEVKFLKSKADTYASRLWTSNLYKMDVYMFHRSTYVPSMTYSLPLTTISRSDLNLIQRRAIGSILNGLGVNKNFPRKVAFGPKSMCGLALLDLSVDQGVRGITRLMNKLYCKDVVGDMILIELRMLQLESGSGSHLLEDPTNDIPYLTPCWITSLRAFMAENDITAKVTKARKTELSREHDRYIMDDIRSLETFSTDELKDINACRIHLQVTTLSDIVEADGKRITDEAIRGIPLSDRFSREKWPRHLQVVTRQRNLWRKALEQCYVTEGRMLKAPLGCWTARPSQCWRNFYDSRSRHLVMEKDGRYLEYKISDESRHSVHAHSVVSVSRYTSLTDVEWEQVVPMTVIKKQPEWLRARYTPTVTKVIETQRDPKSFEDFVESLPQMERRLLTRVHFVPGGKRVLLDCLREGKRLRIGSDGSLNPDSGMGSFGWLLIGKDQVLVEAQGPVDGAVDHLSSTRTELFGIGSAGVLLSAFCQYHGIDDTTSKAILHVDNRASITRVKRMQKKYARRKRMGHDADILACIEATMKELPVRLKLAWVKGHQDKETPYESLPIAGRMNVDADRLAEQFRLRMEAGLESVIREGLHVPSMGISISVRGVRITSRYSHTIRAMIQGRKHREYLQERHGWNNETWRMIDHGSLTTAYLCQGPLQRIQCSKMMHGWLNTGRQKKKISPNAVDSHKCPRCGEPDESQEHILRCPAASAHRTRYVLVYNMCKEITPNPRCPVQRIFATCVKSWLENSETPQPDVSTVHDEQSDYLRTALWEQEQIGWHLAMRGYVSRHWKKAVAANPRLVSVEPVSTEDKTKRKPTPEEAADNWMRKLLLHLWEFGYAMWEHRNNVLHDAQLEASRRIRDAAMNEEIIKLYGNANKYAAQDRWLFEQMPLALRLKKPRRSRKRWLTLARVLAARSEHRANNIPGQSLIRHYFARVRQAPRTAQSLTLPDDQEAESRIQAPLTNFFSWVRSDPTQ